jgi:hypothetical protein
MIGRVLMPEDPVIATEDDIKNRDEGFSVSPEIH